MENIKENWKEDLGLDEAFGGGFTMAICGKNHEQIASVFGETIELCEKRTKLMASSPQLIDLLFRMRNVLKNEWPKEEWVEFDIEVGFSETITKALS